MKIEKIEINPHPRLPETHTRVIVTTRAGYSFYCDYAASDEYERPTEEIVRRDWKADRKAFSPYYGF
jgi:hypothetical protein